MSVFTLVIGNKNYSSWSLRGWLALKHTGAAFDEVLIALDQPETRAQLLTHSPTAKVPVLKTADNVIWDSLAIAEYLADCFPDAGLWPENPGDRAIARAVSSEMHSGFVAVRSQMPMDLRNTYASPEPDAALGAEIRRIDDIWQDCRARFGAGGPFLFGTFTIADCMFAPVVGRFAGYQIDVSETSAVYMKAVLATPEMVEWTEAAKSEPWVIKY